MDPVLEVVSLVKDYPAQRALDGVSLEIAQGEIFALLGRNGAGKTTLIGSVFGAVEVLAALFAANLPVADVSIEAARLEDVILRVLKGGAA